MNLGKEFIRSAVRQVGRDGGKIISNKVYKGKHSTPIYSHNPNITASSRSQPNSNYVDTSQIDMSIQPVTKRANIWVLLKGVLIQIIPFGTLAVLVQAIKYIFKKDEYIYVVTPNRIPDKRYNIGYRIEGSSLVKTMQKRLLSDLEKKNTRIRGYYYLISIVLFLGLLFLYSTTLDEEIISESNITYVYSPENTNINVRINQSLTSDILFQIPANDSAIVININGDELTMNGTTARWMKIEYNGKKGWVWSGVLNNSKE